MVQAQEGEEDLAHKRSSDLARNDSILAFERLNVQGMVRNRHLARIISDASWIMLVQCTAHMAERGSGTLGSQLSL
ncbi:MAG: hypothetical protein M1151_00770 [Candidatus Thermoplasmatota archaeon]|nr:hypothetical protein [Candidatus Thermoplasmatota archaeon]MCL5785187.1 hypothetical protein [Candidatus Thermoplasmatota archaeon]